VGALSHPALRPEGTDGKGGSGTEPRFMFDVYIQSQADAWQVIKDIAAGSMA
jgi:predicted phage tail protein